MPFRRRRPLARAALVGGVAFQAGKRAQERLAQETVEAQPEPAQSEWLTEERRHRLEKLVNDEAKS